MENCFGFASLYACCVVYYLRLHYYLVRRTQRNRFIESSAYIIIKYNKWLARVCVWNAHTVIIRLAPYIKKIYTHTHSLLFDNCKCVLLRWKVRIHFLLLYWKTEWLFVIFFCEWCEDGRGKCACFFYILSEKYKYFIYNLSFSR